MEGISKFAMKANTRVYNLPLLAIDLLFLMIFAGVPFPLFLPGSKLIYYKIARHNARIHDINSSYGIIMIVISKMDYTYFYARHCG